MAHRQTVRAQERALYVAHLARAAYLRTDYILPHKIKNYPELRANNRAAMREALESARLWRIVTLPCDR